VRIDLINQFYPPDHAPTGRFLFDLASALARRGERVRVICSRYGYDGGGPYESREVKNGVVVTRLPGMAWGRQRLVGRAINYLIFSFLVFRCLLIRSRSGKVICCTTPPFIGLVVCAAVPRSVTRISWVMDCYPDVLFASRRLRGVLGRWAGSLLNRLAYRYYGRSDQVWSIGESMSSRIRRFRRAAVDVHPLWAMDQLSEQTATEVSRGPLPELRFLYSGNLGLGHRWIDFAEAAEELADSGPSWIFAGGGVRRAELQEWIRDHPYARVEMQRYAADRNLAAHLANADVHLLSIQRGWEGCIVPSKFHNICALGLPVLAVVPRRSEIGGWIADSGAGWVVEPGDHGALMAAIRQAARFEERRWRGRAARRLARALFCKRRNVAALIRALER